MSELSIASLSLSEDMLVMKSMSAFEDLLLLVIKPSPDQILHITSLVNSLKENKLSEILSKAASSPDSENSRIIKMVDNLVRVPDRTISMIGLDQSKVPLEIYPNIFCSLLLRNMAVALNSEKTSLNPIVFSSLIRQLFVTYPQQIAGKRYWWFFLAKWTLKNNDAVNLCQKITEMLEMSVLEKILLALLKYTPNAHTLSRILGRSLIEEGRYNLLVQSMFVRDLAGDSSVSISCLLGYLNLQDHSLVSKLLKKAIEVWSDEVEVDQGDYRHLVILSWMICSAVGHLDDDQQIDVKELVIRVLMKGMVFWLEASRDKRLLGMSLATVVLQKLGGSVPEWHLENNNLLDQLEFLAKGNRPASEEYEEVDLDKQWETENDEQFILENSLSSCKSNEINQKENLIQVSEKTHVKVDLDSDDDDEDDLVAYDMSDDTPYVKDSPPIHYLRDVIDHLSNLESDRQEDCLIAIQKLSSTHLVHEDPSLVPELLQLVLAVNDQPALR